MPHSRLTRRPVLAALAAAAALPWPAHAQAGAMQSWKLATSRRTGHDVAPAPDGGVWFSAQASGQWLPESGTEHITVIRT